MNIMSKLSDTLKELMILNNLNEQSLAENSGIPISCISSYVNGKQAPYIDTIVKLSEYFNCSIDYLLGRCDIRAKAYKNCISFKQKFNELLETNNCKFETFKEKGISRTSFYEWKRGTSLPTLENLVILADYFGCSIDFILGRES